MRADCVERKMNARAPARAAASASRSVPRTLTASASARAPATQAAQCTTASTPSQRPAGTSSGRLPNTRSAAGTPAGMPSAERENVRTTRPAASALVTRRDPMKPFAPVTRSRSGVCGSTPPGSVIRLSCMRAGGNPNRSQAGDVLAAVSAPAVRIDQRHYRRLLKAAIPGADTHRGGILHAFHHS